MAKVEVSSATDKVEAKVADATVMVVAADVITEVADAITGTIATIVITVADSTKSLVMVKAKAAVAADSKLTLKPKHKHSLQWMKQSQRLMPVRLKKYF
jgi:hypothetical protein